MQECSDSSAPRAVVSEVIGVGADAHRLARVGEWCFRLDAHDPAAEPLIRDTDAAERLGFARPRDIRKIITRIWPENQRPAYRATVARNGPGRRAAGEFWLTEAQLLKVITRSETHVADAIVDEMIRVYMAVRRGLAPAPAASPDMAVFVEVIAQMKAMQASITARDAAIASEGQRRDAEIKELRDALAVGVIGPEGARTINTRLGALALLLAGGAKTRVRSCRRQVENRLRKLAGFDGPGSKWANLPRTNFAFVERWIDAAADDVVSAEDRGRREERRAADARAKVAQGDLFPKKN